jgi:hypothetical protein
MIASQKIRPGRFARRHRVLALLAAILLFGTTSCRQASSSGPAVSISGVRVGILPGPLVNDEDAGRREPLFKAGHWTPVLVTIEGKDKLEGAELVVQTVDSDDTFNEYARPLPVFDFTNEHPAYTVVTYARPGRMDSPINVSVRAKGQILATSEKQVYALESSNYLYATLGARIAGLRLPGSEDKLARHSEIAVIDRAAELPARWFGYQTLDMAVLITTNDEFMNGLLNDSERRGALVEWVRRGGKLVLTVGKNQSLLQNREDLKDFLPVDFVGTESADSVTVSDVGSSGITASDSLGDTTNKTPLTIAKMTFKPDHGVRIRAEAKTGTQSLPLVVSAGYGLGRVTILAIDPDQPPFTRWKSQPVFWQKLIQDAGPTYVDTSKDNTVGFGQELRTDEVPMQLLRSLESFSSVPVISFGWVALFILLYIIVVGPLDYLFLKKVVKRLELTWVTFPLVVLAVSAGAYFAAYSLKGNDQKINKLDLIDVDLNTKTAQGSTWFSIFSPRVQNYTIGIQPAQGWGLSKDPASPPLVSWLGRVDMRRQSLFRRSYDYDSNLGGLQRVPIQVWSTKGFQGSWSHRIDQASPPIVAELRAVNDGLTGSITSNLPVQLVNCELFYRGKVYDLDKITPGAENRKQVGVQERSFEEWAKSNPAIPVQAPPTTRMPFGPPPVPTQFEPSRSIVRSIMFFDAFEFGASHRVRNAGFRELDESWRIQKTDTDGAILYGEIPMVEGAAEDVLKQPATVTQIWIGAIPGSGTERPPMSGTMRQETHMRFYVPVKK